MLVCMVRARFSFPLGPLFFWCSVSSETWANLYSQLECQGLVTSSECQLMPAVGSPPNSTGFIVNFCK